MTRQLRQLDNISHFTDETVLWSAVRDGDAGAFKALYEAYADVLYRYGLRFFDDEDTVKDCMHDLFVDLHRYHRNLSPAVNIRFYLLGAFRRKLHEARRKASLIRFGAPAEMPFLIEFDVEQQLVENERQQAMLRQLAAALSRLPSRQKEVLYLRYNCDLGYEEVAEIMKISIPTCRTLAYRAIQQLREQVKTAPMYLIAACLLALSRG
ncbi:sigma-70 family RNA polymerase sigma factor [Chitinophaga lutea]|uniref:Sigma-70 family RNA polymerase sigma factor n=1 Tax=Chitinophaga lutea TaxID=2488634 RepID=A0A3N4PZA9_9BACT|nr:sigma-70 family RNA polymerase sigma factor [Chitinophaga lutea]